MAQDQSGLPWPKWPLAGAVIAGRHDELPPAPDGFALTPSGQAEQASAMQVAEIMDIPAELLGLEVPGEGSEQPG